MCGKTHKFTTVDKIAEDNGITNPNAIRVGQEVIIDTVSAGDSYNGGFYSSENQSKVPKDFGKITGDDILKYSKEAARFIGSVPELNNVTTAVATALLPFEGVEVVNKLSLKFLTEKVDKLGKLVGEAVQNYHPNNMQHIQQKIWSGAYFDESSKLTNLKNVVKSLEPTMKVVGMVGNFVGRVDVGLKVAKVIEVVEFDDILTLEEEMACADLFVSLIGLIPIRIGRGIPQAISIYWTYWGYDQYKEWREDSYQELDTTATTPNTISSNLGY